MPGPRPGCGPVAGWLLLAVAGAATADDRRAGDALAIALPLATLGSEWVRGDREGAGQYALSFAVTAGGTELLKRVTAVERPDGTNDLSFPSGHAARAFSSAAYVRARHGTLPALPLYAAALYVGHTRVEANRHRWRDVIGAAVLAEASARWLVTPKGGGRTAFMVASDGQQVTAVFAVRW
jgi:membrane-associated phospholipid phosphatase